MQFFLSASQPAIQRDLGSQLILLLLRHKSSFLLAVVGQPL
nr:MAG TPA: hypothetical protein [Caudoviricetes sp.]